MRLVMKYARGSTRHQNTSSDMRIITTVREMREAAAEAYASGSRIAFVPTMGYLHEGHLSLVDAARAHADVVVMSIFVNPLQFAPTEDLARYPRDIEGDSCKAEGRGVDVLFLPSEKEIYPQEQRITLNPGSLATRWDGEVRPGHFSGVLTVVLKLLNVVRPHVLHLGQKDMQQALLVRAMCEDLDVGTEVRIEPTVRDADGLALSSRNSYLSAEDRDMALAIPRSLQAIRAAFAQPGKKETETLLSRGEEVLSSEPGVKVDYLALVNPATLEPREGRALDGDIALVAARVGGTRLIDNIVL